MRDWLCAEGGWFAPRSAEDRLAEFREFLNALPPHKQEELLSLLFGADGAKLSALKLTMCCNDFSTAAPWST